MSSQSSSRLASAIATQDDRESSPLDDYFADVERSFLPARSTGTPSPPAPAFPLPSPPLLPPHRSRRRRSRNSESSTSSSERVTEALTDAQDSGSVAFRGGAGRLALGAPVHIQPAPPALSPTPPPASGSAGPSATTAPHNEDFAERFKYFVASSGLLEKTQLKSPESSPARITAGSSPIQPENGGYDPAAAHSAAATRFLGPIPITAAALQRWDPDILVTVVIMLGAMVCLLPMTTLVPLVTVAGGGYVWASTEPPVLNNWLAPDLQASEEGDGAAGPLITLEASEVQATAEETTEDDIVLSGLEKLLTESHSLDHTINVSLQVFAPTPDDTEQAHELRLALHRMIEDMTDSLAGATSSLLPLVDKSELAVLSDMYEIPVPGGRRRQGDSSDDSESSDLMPRFSERRRANSSTAGSLSPTIIRSALLSPREREAAVSPLRGSFTVSTAAGPTLPPSSSSPEDKFTKLPKRTPRHKRGSWSSDYSSPSRYFRSNFQLRAAETEEGGREDEQPSELLSPCAPEDSSTYPHFIPLPVSPPARPRTALFPPTRTSPLAQALDLLESADHTPRGTPPFPVLSSGRRSSSHYRRSLQDIPYISSQPASSHEQAMGLAKARANANLSSAKRRSLQAPSVLGDPYARDQVILATTTNLTRARSLPQSDLARIRSVSGQTTPDSSGRRGSLLFEAARSVPGSGSHPGATSWGGPQRPGTSCSRSVSAPFMSSTSAPASKRASLLFTDSRPDIKNLRNVPKARPSLGMGAPSSMMSKPRLSRIPSVSPLTLQGLKAACLGVHLKRRRLAACLLGLRFSQTRTGQYWADVVATLRALSDAMIGHRERLEAFLGEARRDSQVVAAISARANGMVTPPRRYLGQSPGSTPALGAGSSLSSAPGAQSSLHGVLDFAPRDTTEQAIFSALDELQSTLVRVWARAEDVRAHVGADGAPSDLDDTLSPLWREMRSDVGGLLRSIERGRDAVRPNTDLDSSVSADASIDEPETADDSLQNAVLPDDPASLPDFLRAWTVSQDAVGMEPPAGLPGHDEEKLPPVGMDEVFEAIAPAARARAPATMSRDERIAKTREARARGMTLAQLTANATPPDPTAEEEQLRRAAQGEVLTELEGVFGTIRQRKGASSHAGAPAADTSGDDGPTPPAASRTPARHELPLAPAPHLGLPPLGNPFLPGDAADGPESVVAEPRLTQARLAESLSAQFMRLPPIQPVSTRPPAQQ